MPYLRHSESMAGFLDSLQPFVISLFAADSLSSVILRGLVWLAVSVVIIISTDSPNIQTTQRNLKSNLGFFLMFLVLTSGLMYLLFGFSVT